MSTHNICFHGEKETYQYFWIEKSILPRALLLMLQENTKMVIYKNIMCYLKRKKVLVQQHWEMDNNPRSIKFCSSSSGTIIGHKHT